MDTKYWSPHSAKALTIFENTKLAEFQPSPGSICVDRKVISVVARTLNGEIDTSEKQKILAFKFFAQLVESAVLHEKVYYRGDTSDEPAAQTPLLNPLEPIVQSLPGMTEFKHKSRTLIIDNESQEIVSVDPVGIELDLLAASVAGIPYKPNPLASQHTHNLIIQRERDYYGAYVKYTMGSLQNIGRRKIDEINTMLGEARFKLDSPLVFNYVLDKHPQNAKDFFETVIEVRNSKEATAFRKVCADFDLAARAGDNKALFQLQNELQATLIYLSQRYRQPTIKIGIEFPPAISFNPHELWQYIKQRRKRNIAFIEGVYKASLRSEGIRSQFFKLF